MSDPAARYPLSGIRVLDFTHVLAGPFCTRLLADFGADVARVESSRRVDRLGATLPRAGFQGRGDRTAPFLSFNRSKRSIAIDLKSAEGRRLAIRLARAADVVVENFSAGVMKRLELEYETLREGNPRLIHLSMSGYGHSGPRHHATAMNMTLQAYSGMMMATGREGQAPMSIANSWNDYISGFHGCLAVLNALAEREATGIGARIDLSQFECSVSTVGPLVFASAVNRSVPKKLGNRSPMAAPQGVYRCKEEDEWCAIRIASNAHWQALVKAAALSEYDQDADTARFIGRLRRHDEIDRKVGAWTHRLSSAEVEARLRRAGVPARRMRRADDVVKADADNGGGVFPLLDDPPGWSTLVAGNPFAFESGLPAVFRAPYKGEHSRDVLGEWLGLSDDQVAELVSGGAIEEDPQSGR